MAEDEKPPRWWPVAAMLAVVRAANAVDEVKAGHLRAATQALRPSIVCTCKGWTACQAFYPRGYYQYCSSCGTYRSC